jgi:hypothetical protein
MSTFLLPSFLKSRSQNLRVLSNSMLGSYFRSLIKILERLVQEASQLLGEAAKRIGPLVIFLNYCPLRSRHPSPPP